MTVKEKLNRKEIQAFTIYIKEAVEYTYNNILYSQERQQTQANKKRRKPDFKVDDYIYLSKDNLRILERSNKRLDTPNTSPSFMKKKIGHSYELGLPDWMKVHSVFHVDRLRKAVRDPLPGVTVRSSMMPAEA